ncbi:MAG: hypothetical protein JW744_01510 [Candidatus Diapherotrites archaeon]|uniref:Uncharacterized protein n=1 Tax=Candidatus Iainarchaeum sp. TaxID=3101447 RepID=A0A938YU01_9ARCH|nr:hypothetical protein [Candidatus Diapherotrites archaeon]
MGVTLTAQRAPNFAERKVWRCVNCGKSIEETTDMYSRMFCSVQCKEIYFNPVKQV